jgi:hypothetical protein
MSNAQHTPVIDAIKLSGRCNGYWKSASDMARPWVATIDGEVMKNSRKQPFRFASSAAAIAKAKGQY